MVDIKDEIDFKVIKRWLGRGGLKQLAEEEGINYTYASNILNGREMNLKFLEKAVQRALDRKERVMRGIARLKANVEQMKEGTA